VRTSDYTSTRILPHTPPAVGADSSKTTCLKPLFVLVPYVNALLTVVCRIRSGFEISQILFVRVAILVRERDLRIRSKILWQVDDSIVEATRKTPPCGRKS